MAFVGVNIFRMWDERFAWDSISTGLVREIGGIDVQIVRVTWR